MRKEEKNGYIPGIGIEDGMSLITAKLSLANEVIFVISFLNNS